MPDVIFQSIRIERGFNVIFNPFYGRGADKQFYWIYFKYLSKSICWKYKLHYLFTSFNFQQQKTSFLNDKRKKFQSAFSLSTKFDTILNQFNKIKILISWIMVSSWFLSHLKVCVTVLETAISDTPDLNKKYFIWSIMIFTLFYLGAKFTLPSNFFLIVFCRNPIALWFSYIR